MVSKNPVNLWAHSVGSTNSGEGFESMHPQEAEQLIGNTLRI
jgi:hypothetical protein